MKIVITGANGFVGRHLVPVLAAKNYEIILLTRADFNWDDTVLAQKCHGAQAFIHLAGRAHKGGEKKDEHEAVYHLDNVLLTRRSLELAQQSGVKQFIFLSTIGIYGQRHRGNPFVESDAPNPDTPYSRSKLEAEKEIIEFCRVHAMDWTILRPPLVYGADAPGNIGLLQKLIRLASRFGLPLPFASIRNRRSLICVTHLCKIITRCLTSEKSRNQAFNLADSSDRSTPDLLRLLAAQDGRKLRLWPFPVSLLRLGARLTGQSKRLSPLWEDYRVDATKTKNFLDI